MLLNVWRVVAGKPCGLSFFGSPVEQVFAYCVYGFTVLQSIHTHTVEICFYLWVGFKAAERLVCLQLWCGFCSAIYNCTDFN